MARTTKADLLDAIDRWEADPNGTQTCDLLCWVSDVLDLPNREFSADQMRAFVEASYDANGRRTRRKVRA